MKILNTLQELWAYCLYCPLCQDVVRDLQVSLGPPEVSKILSVKRINHNLYIDCSLTIYNRKYHTKVIINLLNNSFQANYSEPEKAVPSVDKASSAHFFLHIQSVCRHCDATTTNSSDMEMDLSGNHIHNIGVTREGIYLLDQKDKYHVTLCYDNSNMLISKCFVDEALGGLVDDNKVITLPLVEFDFSQPKKVVHRIKTLLVFS